MRSAGQTLLDLIFEMKSTAIPDVAYPSVDLQDAYLDFKAILASDEMYKSQDTDGVDLGNSNKIRKLILRLHKEGIDKTWLSNDIKDVFNKLVPLVIRDKKIKTKVI
jgi:hypothetical protein